MVHAPIVLAVLAVQATRPPAPPRDFLLEMNDYFEDEVTGAQVFVAVGTLALAAAGIFVASDSDELRGAAGPVAALALAQIGVGAAVWWRTGDQVRDLTADFTRDPAQVRAAEAARMESVRGLLRLIQIAEVALIGVGLGLAIAGGAAEEPVLSGVGLGLLGQSTVMLSLDMFAADRARRYQRAIAAGR